jgi:hypothetical protein
VASAHRRLRLARRLTGHLSTTDAAVTTGLKRTTLSAHETGQNAISERWPSFMVKRSGLMALAQDG